MDAETFGKFIAQRRKELKMTQADLGSKVMVTDKAVSKWERGLGLPDINTLEPLADALDVSIQELMNAKMTEETRRPMTPAETAIHNTIEVADEQLKAAERRRIRDIIAVVCVLAVFIPTAMHIGVLDVAVGFILALPIICVVAGGILMAISVLQKNNSKPYQTTRKVGIWLLIIAVVLLIAFIIARVAKSSMMM